MLDNETGLINEGKHWYDDELISSPVKYLSNI